MIGRFFAGNREGEQKNRDDPEGASYLSIILARRIGRNTMQL